MIKEIFNGIFGLCMSACIYLFGGFDLGMQTLVVFLVFDYITGVLKAFRNGTVNSSVGAKGIIKKVGFLIVVSMASLIDKHTGNTGTIRNIVIYSFIANEGISILENWAEMGLPLPKQLFDALDKLKGEKKEEKN